MRTLNVLVFLIVAASPLAAETLTHNPVLNGDFAGYPALGIPRHHFWQDATEDQCVADGGRTFIRLPAGKTTRQRVGVYGPLAGQTRLHALVRGAGRVTLRSHDGKGTEASVKSEGEWKPATLQPGDAKPPYHIELHASEGQADFTSVRLDAPLPSVTPQQVADRILSEATWAVNHHLQLAADDVGPVKTAFDARRFNVVTGERMAASGGYVCNLDMIPHTLQFLALLTDDAEWKAKFLGVAEDALRYNVDENGAIVPWDCREDKPRATGHQGYASLIEFLLDAARVSGDAKFARAALKLGDRVRERAPRPDGGLAWALYPDGRRFDAFAYYQDHIYGILHPVILGRLFVETGDGRFLTLARRAAAWEMATHHFGKWAKPDRIDPWCDDYFGVIATGFCALHQQTGRAEFLDHALEAARQLWPSWPPSLGNGSHTAGDQPRTWHIWCYLAQHRGPAAYLDGVRVAALQALNLRQDVDTFWKDFNTAKFGLMDPHEGSPPLNTLAGLATLYEATRDPADLARYYAAFDSAMTGFKRAHGIVSRLPSPTAPPRARPEWAKPEFSFEGPRFFRIALRMAAICRNVPVAVGQHGFPLPTKPMPEAIRAALRREQPASEPAPPDVAAWDAYLNTPTFTASARPERIIKLTAGKAALSYVEDAADYQRWKESVFAVEISPGAALGWETNHGASFAEKYIGLGPSGAKGSFTWKFELPGPVAALMLKDTHVAWSGRDRVRLSTSTDAARWALRYDQKANSKATDWEADVAGDQGDSRTLYMRYEFEADGGTRLPWDRRGACLRRFELRGAIRQ